MVDVSDIFYCFSLLGRGKGRRRSRRWPGGPVLRKNRGAGGGRAPGECLWGGGGGGAKYFFFGPEMPTKAEGGPFGHSIQGHLTHETTKIVKPGTDYLPPPHLIWGSDLSGGKKDPQSQKFARTAAKKFLNNSRGLLVINQ